MVTGSAGLIAIKSPAVPSRALHHLSRQPVSVSKSALSVSYGGRYRGRRRQAGAELWRSGVAGQRGVRDGRRPRRPRRGGGAATVVGRSSEDMAGGVTARSMRSLRGSREAGDAGAQLAWPLGVGPLAQLRSIAGHSQLAWAWASGSRLLTSVSLCLEVVAVSQASTGVDDGCRGRDGAGRR